MASNKDGFTALEITVVTALVGLLVGLGAFSTIQALKSSKIKVATAELEMLGAATLQLAWDTGKWPNGAWRNADASSDNELETLENSSLFEISEDDLYPDWKGPYYEGSLVDPWGNPYFFDSDYKIDRENRVVVGSRGPNGSAMNIYDSDNIFVLLDD